MKNFLTVLAFTAVCISCSKKQSTPASSKTDNTKITDSINAARTKINDSIKSKNHFRDFSGTHKFTHNLIKKTGSVNFTKIEGERDQYKVAGSISESISENDNGKLYVRQGTKTFMSKDGGKTYRLQDMVNGSGFVDYIDIHF
jgi:hypothetical protein